MLGGGSEKAYRICTLSTLRKKCMCGVPKKLSIMRLSLGVPDILEWETQIRMSRSSSLLDQGEDGGGAEGDDTES